MVKPKYASDIAFVPVNFNDRDNIVGKIMEVIEASIPESKQQEAVKSLIKQRVSEYFTHLFNDAYICLKNESPTIGGVWDKYVESIWKTQEDTRPAKEAGSLE